MPPAAATSKEIQLCSDAAYLQAVSDMPDMEYFENKRQQTELACSQWLNILSTSWESSKVGLQVCEDLRLDPTGKEAQETLRAAFGTKAHTTLMKRAGTLRRYIRWFQDTADTRGPFLCAFPLVENDVWQYFPFLRDQGGVLPPRPPFWRLSALPCTLLGFRDVQKFWPREGCWALQHLRRETRVPRVRRPLLSWFICSTCTAY